MRVGWLVVAAVCAGTIARADEVTLRMAAIAPEGTAWARELHAFDRDIQNGTSGAVRMKWYLGGIAGDELTALERVKKNQLDGLAGALFCTRVAPSYWVTRIVGLVHDRIEGRQLINHLIPTLEKEMKERGFVGIGFGTFGAEVFFTRIPVLSMADLRKTRLWTWDLDDFWSKQLPTMGVRSVGLPIEDASAAYEGGEIDGFAAIPTAALAYRWSAQARYYTELPASIMPGCLVISQRAFDQLSIENQKVVRAASAKFVVRFDDLGVQQDHQLLGGLFEHQGLKRAPASPQFLADFRQAADRTREKLVDALLREKKVPESVLHDVLSWLAEHRAHPDAR